MIKRFKRLVFVCLEPQPLTGSSSASENKITTCEIYTTLQTIDNSAGNNNEKMKKNGKITNTNREECYAGKRQRSITEQ